MSAPDLIVFSHLRWTWVWQRPQQLISRLAQRRRVWFVEEPLRTGVPEPRLVGEQTGSVTRMWIELPGDPPGSQEPHVGFDALDEDVFAEAFERVLPPGAAPAVWLYTPLALPHVARLERAALVYDVMDDLASFRKAAPSLRLQHEEALAAADLVFAAGRSLYAGVRSAGPEKTFLFPSGVDVEHFAASSRRRWRARPVAGYVGVIDERVDLDLVAGLAAQLPDWDLELVGPVAKIDPEGLPQAPNVRYPGMLPYERLPEVMAGFDVALMPFALNEATRSISPTKTLEYLAAGLPVVSTRVPDVVADHAAVVAIADDPAEFAAACRRLRSEDRAARARSIRPLLARASWDTIAARMDRLLELAVAGDPVPHHRAPLLADPAAAA